MFIAIYLNIGILKLLRGAQATYFLLNLIHSLLRRLIARVLPNFILVGSWRLCQLRRGLPIQEGPHILMRVLLVNIVNFYLYFVRGKRFTKLIVLIMFSLLSLFIFYKIFVWYIRQSTYILRGLSKSLQRQWRENSHAV